MKLWKTAAIAAATTGATYAAQRAVRHYLRENNQEPVPAVNGAANYKSTPAGQRNAAPVQPRS